MEGPTTTYINGDWQTALPVPVERRLRPWSTSFETVNWDQDAPTKTCWKQTISPYSGPSGGVTRYDDDDDQSIITTDIPRKSKTSEYISKREIVVWWRVVNI